MESFFVPARKAEKHPAKKGIGGIMPSIPFGLKIRYDQKL